VGKPAKPKWKELIFGSIINKLARKCQEIDWYLLSVETQSEPIEVAPVAMVPFSWKNFFKVLSIVILCTLIDWAMFRHLALVNLIMVYLLGVTWVAFKYGRRMSMIASFSSVLFFDFFFVPPYLTFAVADVQYIITFAVMLIVGFAISHLTGRLRRQTIMMRFSDDRTQVLYALSLDLSKSSYPDELFKILLKHIQEFFKCQVVVLTPDAKKKLIPRFSEAEELSLFPNEIAVAQWAYDNKKVAGKDTDTLPGAKGIYLPFVGAEKTVGVIGVFPQEDKQFFNPEQFHILEMFVSQAALAVEGAQLAATALDAASKIESERLKNLLLTTYSSGLPGPLTSISETASELLKPENIKDDLKHTALIEKIKQEVERLNTLIAEIPQIIESEE
jgi:two-component system sensor histidine kinase KdpD